MISQLKGIGKYLTVLLVIVITGAIIVAVRGDQLFLESRSVSWFVGAIFLITMVLCYFFNRSRYFFLLGALFISFYSLHPDFDLLISGGYRDIPIYLIPGVAIPLYILFFALVKEKGILTIWGRIWFGLILLQPLGLLWMISANSDQLYALAVKGNLTPTPMGGSWLPFIVVMIYVIVFFLLTGVKIVYPISSSYLGLLITSFMVVYYRNQFAGLIIFSTLTASLVFIDMIKDMYAMAYIDELTGLPSRRALQQNMLRLGQVYCIAMVDIDRFKQFNDQYGHSIGDQALRFMGSHLKEIDGGRAYRYGGEEFTILFPGKTIDEVRPYLEELRETIATTAFVIRFRERRNMKGGRLEGRRRSSQEVYLTVSIGVAEKSLDHSSAAEVIKAADQALYEAKDNGRNCLIEYESCGQFIDKV